MTDPVEARERAARIVALCDNLVANDGVPTEVLAPIYEYAEMVAASGGREAPDTKEPRDA